MSATTTDHRICRMAITARRAANYRHVREMMVNSNNWARMSTVFSLVVTGIAEARAGDTIVARKHMRIAIDLMKKDQDLRTIQMVEYTEGVTALHGFTCIDLPLFEERSDIEDASGRLEKTTMMLRKKQIQVSIPEGLRTCFECQNGMQWGSQMANLHAVVCILSRVKADQGREYIERVDEMVRGSQNSGALSQQAFLFMLCACAARMGWWNTQYKGRLRSWETVELLVLMGLAPGWRADVLAFLTSKISEDWTFHFDIDVMKSDIIRRWEADRLRLTLPTEEACR